jgi:hypothetical protein
MANVAVVGSQWGDEGKGHTNYPFYLQVSCAKENFQFSAMVL